MFVACVHVLVTPEYIEEFIAASRENAANTILEPGNLRFDVLQQADDPQRFILYEVYRDEDASKCTSKPPTMPAGGNVSSRGWPSRERACSTGRCFQARNGSGRRRRAEAELRTSAA